MRRRDEDAPHLDQLCKWLESEGIRGVIVEEELKGGFQRLWREVLLDQSLNWERRFIKLEGCNIDTVEVLYRSPPSVTGGGG